MLRRFWRAETGIFLALWMALLLFGRTALFRDPGTPWHTVVGETMLRSGQVIQSDPFSFTRHGQPWTAHQWLAECGMAAVYRFGGWGGLLLVAATLLAGVYTWVASRLLRAGFHVLPTGLMLTLLLLGSAPQFHVRPLVVTVALLGITFAWLVDVEAGRRRLRQLWWFVPLVMLWANLHAGVLAGIGTVGLCVGGWCLVWLLGGSSPGKRNVPVRRGRDAVAMAALLSASVLAVLVNPYGLGLPRAWLRTLSIPLPSLIQEHGPLDLADPLSWMTVVLGAGYLVALVGLWPKRPRVSWLLPLVWFVLAYQRVRNAPLFAILGVLAAAEVLPATRWAAWLNRREMLLVARPDEPLGGPGRRWHAAWLPLVLVLAVMWIQATGVCAPLVGPDWAGPDASRFPNELLPELERINRSCPQNTRIFNDMNFGGFLIFHAPRLRVFIDDRCALYGGEFLEAYDRARREDTAQLDRWRRQYGFRYALVETGGPFDRYLEDAGRWTLVRRAPTATLYRFQGDASAAN